MTVTAKNTTAQRHLKHLDRRLVGVSDAIADVRSLVSKVAPTEATVLLQGESGTGKEVIARLVHDCSEHLPLFLIFLLSANYTHFVLFSIQVSGHLLLDT